MITARMVSQKKSGNKLVKAEVDRRDKFCIECASNGGNGTQAYLSASYKHTPNARQPILTQAITGPMSRLKKRSLFKQPQ